MRRPSSSTQTVLTALVDGERHLDARVAQRVRQELAHVPGRTEREFDRRVGHPPQASAVVDDVEEEGEADRHESGFVGMDGRRRRRCAAKQQQQRAGSANDQAQQRHGRNHPDACVPPWAPPQEHDRDEGDHRHGGPGDLPGHFPGQVHQRRAVGQGDHDGVDRTTDPTARKGHDRVEQDGPVQDDGVNGEPRQRCASEAEQIGQEPGRAGERNEIADAGAAIHDLHHGAGNGQSNADREVGDPIRAGETPVLPFGDDPECRDGADGQNRAREPRPSPPMRRHSAPTSR